jgi:hypothetical protein
MSIRHLQHLVEECGGHPKKPEVVPAHGPRGSGFSIDIGLGGSESEGDYVYLERRKKADVIDAAIEVMQGVKLARVVRHPKYVQAYKLLREMDRADLIELAFVLVEEADRGDLTPQGVTPELMERAIARARDKLFRLGTDLRTKRARNGT